MKLASWKEDFEGIFYYSGIIHMKVSNEEECNVTKYAGKWEDEEYLANWIKLESWISLWEDDLFEENIQYHVSWSYKWRVSLWKKWSS